MDGNNAIDPKVVFLVTVTVPEIFAPASSRCRSMESQYIDGVRQSSCSLGMAKTQTRRNATGNANRQGAIVTQHHDPAVAQRFPVMAQTQEIGFFVAIRAALSTTPPKSAMARGSESHDRPRRSHFRVYCARKERHSTRHRAPPRGLFIGMSAAALPCCRHAPQWRAQRESNVRHDSAQTSRDMVFRGISLRRM